MKPKTLINTGIKPKAVKAPIAHKELNLDIKTKNDFVINSEEIQKILGISSVTFNVWLKGGRFEGIRMLKRNKSDTYRFIKADFLEWLNKSLVFA